MVGGLCETAHGLLRRARSWRWHLRTCTRTAASGPASRRRAKEKPRARPDLLVSPAGKGVPHGPRQPAAAANTLWANLADHRGQTKSTARRGDLRRRGSVSAAERTVVFSVRGSAGRARISHRKAFEDATTARRRRQIGLFDRPPRGGSIFKIPFRSSPSQRVTSRGHPMAPRARSEDAVGVTAGGRWKAVGSGRTGRRSHLDGRCGARRPVGGVGR